MDRHRLESYRVLNRSAAGMTGKLFAVNEVSQLFHNSCGKVGENSRIFPCNASIIFSYYANATCYGNSETLILSQ